MTIISVSVTELKQNLGEIINQAAYGGQRIILLSHGKERAALISIEDLRLLEALQKENRRETYQNRQLSLLDEARQLREAVGESGYHIDSTTILEEVREDRLDDLTDLR
jgi:prevent-host-death family protein